MFGERHETLPFAARHDDRENFHELVLNVAGTKISYLFSSTNE
jgi:hypothetical protein